MIFSHLVYFDLIHPLLTHLPFFLTVFMHTLKNLCHFLNLFSFYCYDSQNVMKLICLWIRGQPYKHATPLKKINSTYVTNHQL